MVFHGETRMDKHTEEHCHEPPRVVTWPLIGLAIPSVLIGALCVGSVVFGDYFSDSIYVSPQHDVVAKLSEIVSGAGSMLAHAPFTLAFYLALGGVFAAWFCYLVQPSLPAKIRSWFGWLHTLLDRKYGFDEFNQALFAGGSLGIGKFLWRAGDATLIDGVLVNGSARGVGLLASIARHAQTGFLYHYAFAMILGLLGLLSWFFFL